jgi:hypothetical protein
VHGSATVQKLLGYGRSRVAERSGQDDALAHKPMKSHGPASSNRTSAPFSAANSRLGNVAQSLETQVIVQLIESCILLRAGNHALRTTEEAVAAGVAGRANHPNICRPNSTRFCGDTTFCNTRVIPSSL